MAEVLRDVCPTDGVVGHGVAGPRAGPAGGAQPRVGRGRGPGGPLPLRHHTRYCPLHWILQPGLHMLQVRDLCFVLIILYWCVCRIDRPVVTHQVGRD